MSDFTKEELIEIRIALSDKERTLKYNYEELLAKIQSMIDGYCEHESTENIGGFCWKCTKCGMRFGDETQ